MSKRPQIKGKGADVFFSESETQETSKTEAKIKERRINVSFYFSPSLVEKLDRAWVNRRLQDRKIQKSQIVAEALEAYLKEP